MARYRQPAAMAPAASDPVPGPISSMSPGWRDGVLEQRETRPFDPPAPRATEFREPPLGEPAVEAVRHADQLYCKTPCPVFSEPECPARKPSRLRNNSRFGFLLRKRRRSTLFSAPRLHARV